MTREEAIEQLRLTYWAQRDQGNDYLADAIDMAIEALKQEPCKDATRPHGEWIITSPEPGYTDVRCSVCNHTHMTNHTYDFCPVCGADMRKE